MVCYLGKQNSQSFLWRGPDPRKYWRLAVGARGRNLVFERRFFLEQFTIVRRGYDPDEVDKYISTLEQVIKSYKEKDNAIKNAIISAQVAADNMIKNAKLQADEYKAQIARELNKVSNEVEKQRVKLQAFKDIYTSLVKKYLTLPKEEDMRELFERLDDVDRMVNVLLGDETLMPEGKKAEAKFMPASDSENEPPGLLTPPASSDYY